MRGGLRCWNCRTPYEVEAQERLGYIWRGSRHVSLMIDGIERVYCPNCRYSGRMHTGENLFQFLSMHVNILNNLFGREHMFPERIDNIVREAVKRDLKPHGMRYRS